MKYKNLSILLLVLMSLILTNLVALDFVWLQGENPEVMVSPNLVSIIPSSEKEDDNQAPITHDCNLVCQQMIDEKISQSMATLSGKESVSEATPVEETTTQASSQPQVIYVPLGGGGSTTTRDWADVGNAEVYLDPGDYVGFIGAYFEGFVKVKHGNGKVFARLYDATHEIGVQGGEIISTSESYERVESGPLNLWQGNNLYRVQIKSLNGYEASFDSGRIKIVIR